MRVLRGAWRPRLLRLAVIAALALSGRAGAEPPPSTGGDLTVADEFPVDLDAYAWARWQHGGDRYGGENIWPEVRRSWARGDSAPYHLDSLPKPLADVAKADAPSAAALLAALDAAEAAHLWDTALVSHLWLRSAAAPPAELAPLYGRLERHARVANAITRAAFETGAVQFRPWMSKASAPKEHQALVVSPDLATIARARHASGDAGPWRTQIALRVKVRGAGTLHRGGVARPLAAEEVLARLDLVTAGPEGLVLEHESLGAHRLGPGETLSTWTPAWAVPSTWVEQALYGDADAVTRLERALWVSWRAIQAGLEAHPDAPGAPALRQLLVLHRE